MDVRILGEPRGDRQHFCLMNIRSQEYLHLDLSGEEPVRWAV